MAVTENDGGRAVRCSAWLGARSPRQPLFALPGNVTAIEAMTLAPDAPLMVTACTPRLRRRLAQRQRRRCAKNREAPTWLEEAAALEAKRRNAAALLIEPPPSTRSAAKAAHKTQ